MLHFRSPDIGLFGRRQRHARGHRIPVSIVSDAVEAPQERDTALVIDDFGADGTLLPGIGCQCCTIRPKLQDALRRLLAEREKGKHFSRVVIATRHDLPPILRTFATVRALGSEFYVEHAPALTGNRSVLSEDTPLSWNAFSRFISTLVSLRGPDLLHVKGLLNIEGCRGPVVVQFMQHLSLPPVELQAWPDRAEASRLEFVTRGITENEIRGLLKSIRALSTSS